MLLLNASFSSIIPFRILLYLFQSCPVRLPLPVKSRCFGVWSQVQPWNLRWPLGLNSFAPQGDTEVLGALLTVGWHSRGGSCNQVVSQSLLLATAWVFHAGLPNVFELLLPVLFPFPRGNCLLCRWRFSMPVGGGVFSIFLHRCHKHRTWIWDSLQAIP